MIAVCDHNSAENVKSVQKAADGTGLSVLAGMEITTSEEVHLLAIFGDESHVTRLQKIVYEHLLPGENDEDLFGVQVAANEQDEVEAIVTKLLIGGTTLSLEEAVYIIHEIGGLAVPSHIDRESFSLVAQLGMIPEDLPVDALEVSALVDVENIKHQIPGADRFPLITSSDAHRLDEIGRVTTTFKMADATLEEIEKALKRIDGRSILHAGGSPC
jgi:PHP family Zn ribbon phosphoesterase